MGGCVYINPDVIAEQEFGDWNSSDSIFRAADEAKRRREKCLVNGTSVAFETVFSTSEKVDFVRRAKAAGFFVRLFFICTNDPSINAQRVALRVMEGGHDVPISKIISRYYRSIEKCVESLQWVDRAYFYDNSETDVAPALIFRVADGKVAKVYTSPVAWSQAISDSLRRA